MYLSELNLRIYDFQGFVIHNELENNECFLESVSNPYHFNDENQILYIRSSILKVNERKNPCNWHFSAPDGYGFKIVIVEFNALSDVTLAVTNSTNFYIVNQHSVIIDKPYYNEDQNLYVFLSNSNQSFLLRYEFGAYITIIKTKFEVVDAKCVIDDDDSWTSNYYHSNGYPNNAYCNYTLEIPPNTIVIAQRHDDYIIEKADFVIYFDVLSNSYEHFNNNDVAKTFYAFKNNSIRKINWGFKSDGSVRGGDDIEFVFKMQFSDCFCNSPIFFVYCDGTYYEYHVTNTTSSVAYCGNMKCNSTIKLDPSCPKHLFIQLTIVTSAYPSKLIDFTDNFRLITDNETIVSVSSTNFSYTMVQIYINPNSTNIFESLTADTELLIPRELYLELLATESSEKFI
uniref:CUB domain-containing protein n=1 Tax=Panagrolaimus davidi TaxID=227884 RepID=A0A914Q395_9BILA